MTAEFNGLDFPSPEVMEKAPRKNGRRDTALTLWSTLYDLLGRDPVPTGGSIREFNLARFIRNEGLTIQHLVTTDIHAGLRDTSTDAASHSFRQVRVGHNGLDRRGIATQWAFGLQ